MAKFYSPSTLGFYDDRIHGSGIPADALPVTEEQHCLLLEAQAEGRVIAVIGGEIVAQPRLPPDQGQLLSALRRKRDLLLRGSDFTQIPDAPLSLTERHAWATYRQALRDLTGLYADNPGEAIWPVPPAQL